MNVSICWQLRLPQICLLTQDLTFIPRLSYSQLLQKFLNLAKQCFQTNICWLIHWGGPHFMSSRDKIWLFFTWSYDHWNCRELEYGPNIILLAFRTLSLPLDFPIHPFWSAVRCFDWTSDYQIEMFKSSNWLSRLAYLHAITLKVDAHLDLWHFQILHVWILLKLYFCMAVGQLDDSKKEQPLLVLCHLSPFYLLLYACLSRPRHDNLKCLS